MAEAGICEECGQKEYLDEHHKDRNHKNNIKSNKKYLCKRCHGREHGSEGAEVSEERFDLTTEVGKTREDIRIREGFELLNPEE